jgi:hypothetical protein
MNTELYRMIVNAEQRYLTDEEVAAIGEYALNMGARIEAARRLEQAEEAIVHDAIEACAKKYPEYMKRVPDAREKGVRDLKLVLRYLAAAYVRKDPEFFRRNFAVWVAETLRALIDKELLVDGQLFLRAAMEKHLDAVDVRAFTALQEIFIAELAK